MFFLIFKDYTVKTTSAVCGGTTSTGIHGTNCSGITGTTSTGTACLNQSFLPGTFTPEYLAHVGADYPCKDGTFEDRNIKYTNHGGERIFYGEGEEQQIKFPFHEYGYIELKPNFTDTLKKLLAMSFEYLLEPSRNAKQDRIIDPKPENEMFCISCGKDNITMTPLFRGDNRHYYNCTCNETDCGHKIYIDYCWNCKTKLFKHGSYWDYHLESTWSIFDIRCPNCGMTVADRPQTTDF